jgi:hypothetical protein
MYDASGATLPKPCEQAGSSPLLMAVGCSRSVKTRHKSETALGSACSDLALTVRSTGVLALREATMEIGAHFMHVCDGTPTIVSAGM